MRNIKSQKGSITILVLVSMLFFVASLISTYVILSNKAQTQKEIVEETKKIYEGENVEEAYNSYFENNIDGVIPIYTAEELQKIGSGENVVINEEKGKIYYFPMAEDNMYKIYVLKNDIEFNKNDGIWTLEAEGRIEGGEHIIKINTTNPSTLKTTSYYYTNKNDYSFPLTKDNYAYQGLILHYDGINNYNNTTHSTNTTTWKDLSGNENNGALDSFDFTNTSGWSENALLFDGVNDRIITTYKPDLASSEFTIDMTINKTSVINADRSIIFVKWVGYTIELNANNTTVFGVNPATPYLSTPTAQSLNTKYNITATFKDGTQKLYINGNKVNERAIIGTVTNSNNNLTIGAYGVKYYFNGYIYEIKMYNRELNQNEINLNYQTTRSRYEIN